MSSVEAVILGILQGLTEFLPISSSAHLLVLPWLLEWQQGGLVFDVILHGGTLLALAAYFRGDLWTMLRRLATARPEERRDAWRLPLALTAGSVPIFVVGAAAKSWIVDTLRTPQIAIFNLAFFGLLLGLADWKSRRRRNADGVSILEGGCIGLAQALALAPGVSRSGITITAAMLLGLSRVEAARFAFLLGIPAIAAATASAVLDWLSSPGSAGVGANALLLGVISAFVSGFVCIKYFLRFLENGSLLWFAAYRCCLAAVAAYLLL